MMDIGATTKTVEVVLASLASLVPILIKLLKRIPLSWLRTFSVSAFCGVAVYGAMILPDFRKPHITILDPPRGSIVDCQSVSPEGYCMHVVSGTLSRPLRGDQKLYVAIKETGGDEWWISGGATQQQDVTNQLWKQPWASFSGMDSPVKSYSVCAFVTEEQFAPDSKLKVLPNESIVSSTTILVQRR